MQVISIKINTLLFVGLLFSLLLVNSGCKKNKNTMVDYSHGVNVTTDYVFAQHLNISITNTYFKAIYDTLLMNTGKSEIDGAVVKYFPDSIFQLKIIYPYWGKDDGYGNWRQGEIHIMANGGFFNLDEPAKFHFEKFYFTKDTITADLFEMKYLGKNGSDDNFQLITENEKRTFVDSTGSITINSMQNYSVKLSDTNQYQAEYILISGSMNGCSRNESVFNVTSKNDMLSDLHCNWMKQGEVEMIFNETDYKGMVFFSNPEDCENWYNLVIENVDFPSSIEKPKLY